MPSSGLIYYGVSSSPAILARHFISHGGRIAEETADAPPIFRFPDFEPAIWAMAISWRQPAASADDFAFRGAVTMLALVSHRR